jgi:hypothetical protein
LSIRFEARILVFCMVFNTQLSQVPGGVMTPPYNIIVR